MKTEQRKTENDDEMDFYDPTDDLDPAELGLDPGELVLDVRALQGDYDPEINLEFFLAAVERQEKEEAEKRRRDRWVSAGVILGVVTFIATIVYINFRNV